MSVGEIEAALRKQGISVGLRAPKETQFSKYLDRAPIIRTLGRMDKLEQGVAQNIETDGKNKKDKKEQRWTMIKHRLLPAVKNLFDRKRGIIGEVSSGEKRLVEGDWEKLKSIFTPIEFRALVGYSSFLRREKGDKGTFDDMVVVAARGKLNSKRLDYFAAELGETAAAKMRIVYNDIMVTFGTWQKRLREGRRIAKLRRDIEGYRQQKDQANALGKLIVNLGLGQFESEKSFVEAVKVVGPYAIMLFESIDWRDQPFLVQFAVGTNGKINNPLYYKSSRDESSHPKYANQEEHWIAWGGRERDKFAETLKEASRKLLEQMKATQLF